MSHYTEACAIARDFAPGFSIVYAADHLIALENRRAMIKPEKMTVEEWKTYKENTETIQRIVKELHEIAGKL